MDASNGTAFNEVDKAIDTYGKALEVFERSCLGDDSDASEEACRSLQIALLGLREAHRIALSANEKNRQLDSAWEKDIRASYSEQDNTRFAIRSVQAAIDRCHQYPRPEMTRLIAALPSEDHDKVPSLDFEELSQLLQVEKLRRGQLASEVSELKALHKKESAELGDRKTLASGLVKKLVDAETAVKPVYELLAPEIQERPAMFEKPSDGAKSLQGPLYVLYAKLDALITFSGDQGLAIEILPVPHEEDSSDAPPTKRAKVDPKTGSTKRSEDHPRLAVFVDIAPKATDTSFKSAARLRFECTSTQIVMVSVVKGSSDIVQELFPGDLGKWPTESLGKQMHGQPFYWAQVLAGQSQYVVVPDRELLEDSITTSDVLGRIRNRLSGSS